MSDKRGPASLQDCLRGVHLVIGEDNAFLCLRARRNKDEQTTQLEYIANMSHVDAARTLARVLEQIIGDMSPTERKELVGQVEIIHTERAPSGSKTNQSN